MVRNLSTHYLFTYIITSHPYNTVLILDLNRLEKLPSITIDLAGGRGRGAHLVPRPLAGAALWTLRKHPLGASRCPKNHIGSPQSLHRTHAIQSARNLPPDDAHSPQEHAQRQRQAMVAAKEGVVSDLQTHRKRHQASARSYMWVRLRTRSGRAAESCVRAVVVARATMPPM